MIDCVKCSHSNPVPPGLLPVYLPLLWVPLSVFKKQKCFFVCLFHDLVFFIPKMLFMLFFNFLLFFFFQMCINGPSFEISLSDLSCGVCRNLRVNLKLVAPCLCSMGSPLGLAVCLLSGGWNNAQSYACREKGQKPL